MYMCVYKFEGQEYDVAVQARTHGEAQRRLRAIGLTGEVMGAFVGDALPAREPQPGRLARAWALLRRLKRP